MYISSRRDFSQADRRRAAAQDRSAPIDGHENSKRFDPAVLRVKTFVYCFEGALAVAGTVTEPRACMNYDNRINKNLSLCRDMTLLTLRRSHWHK